MKRICLILLAIAFLFVGCDFIQINPDTDIQKYENFGRTVGAYYKVKNPEAVVGTTTWVKGVLKMTDQQVISGDIIQVAYEFLLEEESEDADMIAMVKTGLDLFGIRIKINASDLIPEEQYLYVASARAFFTGYAKATGIQ